MHLHGFSALYRSIPWFGQFCAFEHMFDAFLRIYTHVLTTVSQYPMVWALFLTTVSQYPMVWALFLTTVSQYPMVWALFLTTVSQYPMVSTLPGTPPGSPPRDPSRTPSQKGLQVNDLTVFGAHFPQIWLRGPFEGPRGVRSIPWFWHCF